jgi:3-hydroxyacyl-CoA dehydrogenase
LALVYKSSLSDCNDLSAFTSSTRSLLVEATAGFVVNRILTRLFSEVLDLLDCGLT